MTKPRGPLGDAGLSMATMWPAATASKFSSDHAMEFGYEGAAASRAAWKREAMLSATQKTSGGVECSVSAWRYWWYWGEFLAGNGGCCDEEI